MVRIQQWQGCAGKGGTPVTLLADAIFNHPSFPLQLLNHSLSFSTISTISLLNSQSLHRPPVQENSIDPLKHTNEQRNCTAHLWIYFPLSRMWIHSLLLVVLQSANSAETSPICYNSKRNKIQPEREQQYCRNTLITVSVIPPQTARTSAIADI